ncbi:hypothetical protein Thena_0307 [Thermodesulfobium narugense DSM 14796]|uniref:Prepilin-type N-terminal cleavage/methylation domain-containing protein n=1 Tax=Thermodesulfobium narugense DSM 14796 TaxID=747365 RepID=M1E7F0_9BACT|nr:prepilin-type N-terminal cleavage/methylation domain-containing protein [Thermodesulfobium narugense]AEE13954.1 hypothetical protein Thena_0307 [Thermodesulfobium narugense DSM 14796]
MQSFPRKSLRNKRGFTLIELLVVIVIIGILAAVAFPIYQNFMKNAADADAKGALASLRSAEALYYAQYGTYTKDIGTLAGMVQTQGGITVGANGISVTAGGATYNYTITADSTSGLVSCTGNGAMGTSCSNW